LSAIFIAGAQATEQHTKTAIRFCMVIRYSEVSAASKFPAGR
jgi:hypothetical protein